MNKSELKENLKTGIARGYMQNLLLLSSYNNFIDQVREYLLTVNVAQQLLEWNNQHLYKIQIEYPISLFYENAFIRTDWIAPDIFNMSIVERLRGHSPTEKLHQKIDIAITQEQQNTSFSTDERTIVGIELKGINKNQADIINDAERMCNAMLRTDPISPNSIEICFCGFIKRFDKAEELVTKDYIQTKISEVQSNWDNICNILHIKYQGLNFTTDLFEIQVTTFETIADIHKQMGSDYSEVANDTGIVIGCILSIER